MKANGAALRSISLLALLAALISGLPGRLSAQEAALVFGVYPSNDLGKVSQAFAPLEAYLQATLKRPVRLIVSKDYDELVRRLADGSVDLAWLGPSAYLRAIEAMPALRYLATYMERDAQGRPSAYYRSLIVCAASSGFSSLSQLKGRHIGFVDRGSTSGYAYPLVMLKDAGIDIDSFFSKQFFLKRHDKVAEALLAGSIAAGAISDGTYATIVAERGPVLTVLAESKPIPLDALVAKPGITAATAAALRQALLALKPGDEALAAIERHLAWPAMGFSVMPADFYDGLKAALEAASSRPADGP
jgi:phosphonate transport system substrate-binding protein